MEHSKTGVWVVGALGSLATTVMVGARAIARGLASSEGLVTGRSDLANPDLVSLADLEFGGHEIRCGTVVDSAREIARQNGSLRNDWIEQLTPDLDAITSRIRPGLAQGCGSSIEELVEQSPPGSLATGREAIVLLRRDLEEFRQSTGVERLIVVNLASTEPPTPWSAPYRTRADLETTLDASAPEPALRSGLLYAYAALEAGAGYINFTPSTSALCPSIEQFATDRGLPYMGNDGKSGETLVKTALAPMFRCRNLRVKSWVGYNLLGNRDGQILADEENKASKVQAKDSVLASILGAPPDSRVGIDYLQSLGDQKVAWDFIHFAGFLGFPMSMQFTWHGCDSILAAPLVLDLARMVDLALQRGEAGPCTHLASYFKSPLHCGEHDLFRQFRLLTDYLEQRAPGP